MIYFVRHGSTDWNDNIGSDGKKDPKCQGRVDLPLNERGVAQAKETAKIISGGGVEFSKVICSPLLRARQTCEIIYHGKLPVQIDDRVIERDFGEFEGLSRSEFDFKGFWNAFSPQNYIRAESLADVQKRVFDLLEELKSKPEENVLIVSHGGVGLVLMSYFKGVSKDGDYLKYEIPNGKPLVLDFNETIDNSHLNERKKYKKPIK